jgi:N-acetylmuramoyl-L-alanine amidase
MRVTIDAGHGGDYSGAVGSAGVPEKAVTLAVALQLAALFGMNDQHQVRLTRWGDHHFDGDHLANDLLERCRLANNWPADVFVSLHCNAYSDPAAHGYEVWTNNAVDPADALAGVMWYRMRQEFPDMRGRADFSDNDPDKESQFVVLARTDMPAVLVEMAFISNPADQARLLDPAWQVRQATVLWEALCDWSSD